MELSPLVLYLKCVPSLLKGHTPLLKITLALISIMIGMVPLIQMAFYLKQDKQ
jgi:hypothetical protein